MNSTSVHRDCVEDAETLLSDICFNEDFYSKPPTVEFTVIDEVVVSSNGSGSSVIDDSVVSSKARRSSTSDANSSSSSSRNTSASSSNVLNISAQRSNITSSSFNPSTSTSASRIKAGRIPPAEHSEPSLKVAYSSGVEIPLDYSIGQEISIYTSGRNRKVYYGLNGAPYYITDTGTYVRNTPSLILFKNMSSLQIENEYFQISRSYINKEIHFLVLCCTVLYCTVLYCTVLYCTVLYCTVL